MIKYIMITFRYAFVFLNFFWYELIPKKTFFLHVVGLFSFFNKKI